MGTTQRLFCAGASDSVSPYETLVGFNTNDQLLITINGNGATGGSATTSGVASGVASGVTSATASGVASGVTSATASGVTSATGSATLTYGTVTVTTMT